MVERESYGVEIQAVFDVGNCPVGTWHHYGFDGEYPFHTGDGCFSLDLRIIYDIRRFVGKIGGARLTHKECAHPLKVPNSKVYRIVELKRSWRS